jgi:hypothetical protein
MDAGHLRRRRKIAFLLKILIYFRFFASSRWLRISLRG